MAYNNRTARGAAAHKEAMAHIAKLTQTTEMLRSAPALWLPETWQRAAFGVMMLVNVSMSFVTRFHSAYQPWCPYCRRGGKSGKRAPEAAPDPSSNQPVPA
jgi:hypothetical protein